MARTRHVKKWILITSLSLIAACVLVSVGLVAVAGSLGIPTPAPFHLLPLSPAASTAVPDGTWIVGDGSAAGFRVPESFFVQSSTIVASHRSDRFGTRLGRAFHARDHTPLAFTVLARYNGAVLEAVGSAPSLASDWNIISPFGV